MLFPGQGSQFVGMGQKIMQYPQVRQLYDRASEHLGYDLLDICLNGPKETLDKTEYCQPAVFVTSLATIEVLKETNPKAFDHVIATAGFSLGEITACVFAGILSFDDALKLISVRASAMQEASEEVNSGMITLKLFYASRLPLAIDCAIEYCRFKLNMENPIVRIANYLSPEYQVVAGHDEALEFIIENAEDFNLRSIRRLPVSGAFHTQLMNPAREEVRKVVRRLTLNPPKFPVHTNINGKAPTKITTIERNLSDQIVKPVSWIQTMMILYRRHPGTPYPQTYECGPGKQLGHLLYLTNRPARANYHKIEV
ncbi:hypothetical protein FSP39_006574 [Pinctada imbricata]|uniref:Malonyl-CoA:ACP transacylase (MAT) domain-containing protein n=1 Tax=Pinctada imbricata TaxID=66713 RepID=A0AA88XJT0_PINIB|nr:hypothetical protein FSP39_006574 [Pinctada imbricata]